MILKISLGNHVPIVEWTYSEVLHVEILKKYITPLLRTSDTGSLFSLEKCAGEYGQVFNILLQRVHVCSESLSMGSASAGLKVSAAITLPLKSAK